MSLAFLTIFCLVSSSLGSPHPSPDADPYKIIRTVETFSKAEEQSDEKLVVANFRKSSLCEEGWTEFNHTGKCYKTIPGRLSWDKASSACKSAVAEPSASLASIPDQMTNDFLITISKFAAEVHPRSVWVGGFQSSDNEWAWSDGSEMTFTNWENAQPNNCCGGQNYVVFYPFSQGKWNDIKKSRRKRALCQYDLPITTTSTTTITSTTLTSTKTTSIITNNTTGTTTSTAVVLITGGFNYECRKIKPFSTDRLKRQSLKSAEIFNPVTKISCSLPQLPEHRESHSEDRGLACGGTAIKTQTSCVTWIPALGFWNKSHTLRQKRNYHVSWATASGVYLIGGQYSKRTSEKVKLNGSVEEGFSLKYDTMKACAISDNEEVIITGGANQVKTVSVYSEGGWKRDLASLNQGRHDHACGSYVNGGKKFLMVTGGWAFDSTEIFSDNVWRTVAALPYRINGLTLATINNRVLSFGGHWWRNGNQCQFYSKEILEFNYETESWRRIGTMKERRSSHDMSVVSLDDYEKWCN